MSEATDAMDENDRECARLATLLARMEHGDFAQTVHEGWTVTAKLGHLAFWDRFALGLLERWAAGEPYETGTDDAWFDDTLNDALLAEWRALIPAVARQLVLAAAEAVDARLRRLEDGQAERLLVDHDAEWLLRRHRHRAEHLDEIEGALAAM